MEKNRFMHVPHMGHHVGAPVRLKNRQFFLRIGVIRSDRRGIPLPYPPDL